MCTEHYNSYCSVKVKGLHIDMILISFVMTAILMINTGKENQIQDIYNCDILKMKFSSGKIILIFKITEV